MFSIYQELKNGFVYALILCIAKYIIKKYNMRINKGTLNISYLQDITREFVMLLLHIKV